MFYLVITEERNTFKNPVIIIKLGELSLHNFDYLNKLQNITNNFDKNYSGS